MPKIERPKPPETPSEPRIQDEIRLDLGREPDLVLWRLANGAFYAPGAGGEIALVRAGIKGAADLVGILRIKVTIEGYCPPLGCRECNGSGKHCVLFGRFFALEVKAPGKLPRPLEILRAMAARASLNKAQQHELDQQEWAALVRAHGGFAAFVDSRAAARAALERARRGEVQ